MSQINYIKERAILAATPSTPTAGYYKSYVKSDGRTYQLLPSGDEIVMSAMGATALAEYSMSANNGGVGTTWEAVPFDTDLFPAATDTSLAANNVVFNQDGFYFVTYNVRFRSKDAGNAINNPETRARINNVNYTRGDGACFLYEFNGDGVCNSSFFYEATAGDTLTIQGRLKSGTTTQMRLESNITVQRIT